MRVYFLLFIGIFLLTACGSDSSTDGGSSKQEPQNQESQDIKESPATIQTGSSNSILKNKFTESFFEKNANLKPKFDRYVELGKVVDKLVGVMPLKSAPTSKVDIVENMEKLSNEQQLELQSALFEMSALSKPIFTTLVAIIDRSTEDLKGLDNEVQLRAIMDEFEKRAEKDEAITFILLYGVQAIFEFVVIPEFMRVRTQFLTKQATNQIPYDFVKGTNQETGGFHQKLVVKGPDIFKGPHQDPNENAFENWKRTRVVLSALKKELKSLITLFYETEFSFINPDEVEKSENGGTKSHTPETNSIVSAIEFYFMSMQDHDDFGVIRNRILNHLIEEAEEATFEAESEGPSSESENPKK